MQLSQEMSKQFIQLTSGWIPVVVMALLAIALVGGQANADVEAEKRLPGLVTTVPHLDADVLDMAPVLRRIEEIKRVFESRHKDLQNGDAAHADKVVLRPVSHPGRH